MKKRSDDDDHIGDWPEPTSIVGIIGATILFLAAISAIGVVAAKIF